MVAADCSQVRAVWALLKLSADEAATDGDGHTARAYAADQGHEEVLAVLGGGLGESRPTAAIPMDDPCCSCKPYCKLPRDLGGDRGAGKAAGAGELYHRLPACLLHVDSNRRESFGPLCSPANWSPTAAHSVAHTACCLLFLCRSRYPAVSLRPSLAQRHDC